MGVEVRHHIGVKALLWATDFPHQDSEWPRSMDVVARNFTGVPADETRRMVLDNAVEFFHLNDDMATRAGRQAADPAQVS